MQYVDCPTRENKTLDLLYANVKEAYTSTALPPLDRSDHNLVLLQPSYKSCVVRQPVTTRTFRKWTPEAKEALRACYECTDWNVLQDTEGNRGVTEVDRRVECYTGYMTFCRDMIVPARTVRCFPNNKPWITCDIKRLLNQKKAAYREGDREKRRLVQRELKRSLKQAKEDHKKKVERKLQHNNTGEVWRGMKTITGYKQKGSLATAPDVAKANEFNYFYNRFDSAASSSSALPSPSPHLSSSNSLPPFTSSSSQLQP